MDSDIDVYIVICALSVNSIVTGYEFLTCLTNGWLRSFLFCFVSDVDPGDVFRLNALCSSIYEGIVLLVAALCIILRYHRHELIDTHCKMCLASFKKNLRILFSLAL